MFIYYYDCGKKVFAAHVVEDIEASIIHTDTTAENCEPPTLEEFIKTESNGAFCHQAAKQTAHSGTKVLLDRGGVVIRHV